MKLPFVLLFVGVTLFNVACKEKEEIDINRPLGTALVYDKIFVLKDNGLVSAHQYIVDFAAQGGPVDLNVVSFGITGNGPNVASDQFVVELLDKISDDDSGVRIYDYVDHPVVRAIETVKAPRYIQTLRITARPNGSKEQQEARISISMENIVDISCSIARADITLRQAGAE